MAASVAQDNDLAVRDPSGPAGASPAPRGWIRRLFAYCRRYPVVTTLAVIGSCALALNALIPLLTKTVVDGIGAGASTTGAITGLVAVAIGLFGTTFLRRWSAGRLSLSVQHDLRQDVFGAIQRLDGPGQDRLRTGQVVSRANSDLQMVQGLMSMVPLVFGQLVMILVSLVLMLVLSPLLTLTALIVVPAAFYVVRQLRTQLFPATWTAQQSAADVADVVEENVTGVRVVKGFGQEEREIGRLRAVARRLYAHRMRSARITARSNILASVTSFGQVLVLLLGGWLTISGSIGLGTFVAFTLYLTSLVGPTRSVSVMFVLAQQAGAAVDRVLEIVDMDAEVTDPEDPRPVPAGPLAVELADVRFGYAVDDAVLQGFSLTVPAGRTVAVVGPSGSGKSTLSLLLPRFYDVAGGAVRVGGVPIRDVAMADLRAAVGVVFEEAFLFSSSIAENIRYGRPDATDAEVRTAAEAAEATEFIERLPQGYDTVIGERGLTLSGGQRQRLALARAMITDPRVLVLDDATSAVDPATEAAILATLRRLTADRTTVLIAHRRSTLRLADTIAVVEAGRVVDHGTHDELTRRCGLYRRLLGSELADRPSGADLQPGPDGVTPQLWPVEVPEIDGDPSLRALEKTSSAGRGGGGGGFMGGMAAAPLTPQLAARIAALPPADDTPLTTAGADVDPTPVPGRRFSLREAMRPVRSLLLVAVVLVALSAGVVAAVPALLRTGVDRGVTQGAMSVVVWLAVGTTVLVIVDYLVQRQQTITTARAGESVLFGLRSRSFRHLQRLGLDYYEREQAGRVMTRMTSDVDALSSFLQTGLVTAVVALATFVAIAVSLLLMNASLALVAFAVLPILLVATFFFRRYSSAQYTLAREQVAVVNADLQENVAGLRIAQSLGRQGRNSATFAEKSDSYRKIRMRAQTAISLYFPFVALLADLAAAAVLAVGAQRVEAGTLTAGTLLAFVLYLGSFFTPIQQLSQVFDGYQQAAVSLRRIGELLDTPTSTPAAAEPVAVRGLSGTVTFEGVGFRYADDTPWALLDVDLAFVPGETVAVVGATGAGKSTLVKLIARFYDVTTGRVLIGLRDDGDTTHGGTTHGGTTHGGTTDGGTADGGTTHGGTTHGGTTHGKADLGTLEPQTLDLRTLDLPSYRQRLGVVPQEAHLFTGTVRDNIAYGRPEATDAEVEQAARAVGALEVIAALTHGFRHTIDERGRNLSAGQRQLVSLARAELVQPDVLLLDEATAALDPAAELAVLDATDRVAAGRTTIVVAHRLTTASRADRIIVMAGGRVAEIGTHDALLARGGAYADLYRDRDDAAAPA